MEDNPVSDLWAEAFASDAAAAAATAGGTGTGSGRRRRHPRARMAHISSGSGNQLADQFIQVCTYVYYSLNFHVKIQGDAM